MHKADGAQGQLALRANCSTEPASTTNVAEDIDTRFIFRTTDETLWFDKNGSRAGGLTLIADLQNNAAVSHDDILLL